MTVETFVRITPELRRRLEDKMARARLADDPYEAIRQSRPKKRGGHHQHYFDGRFDRAGELSPTQELILSMVADGMTNAEIAVERNITEATVATQVQTILRKLGAANRANAVALGYQRGILRAA